MSADRKRKVLINRNGATCSFCGEYRNEVATAGRASICAGCAKRAVGRIQCRGRCKPGEPGYDGNSNWPSVVFAGQGGSR